MPRWPDGYVARAKQTCVCGARKDYYALTCRKCSIPRKPLLGVSGEQHLAWKGGSRIDRDGYIRTYCPDHPWPRKSGYVLEHVRVMEIHLGRRLRPGESVHHKDGDRRNNALANLEVMGHGDHSRLHRLRDSHLRTRDRLGRFAGKEALNASE